MNFGKGLELFGGDGKENGLTNLSAHFHVILNLRL